MNARKMLCSLFASLSLGAAGAAAAQEAPQTPAEPAVETAAITTTEEPALFNVRDYFIKNEAGEVFDSRAPMYLCDTNNQDCWTQEQREAWAVREFQLMMRTTVYTCQQFYPNENLIDHYNNFVTNNQETLQRNFHTVAAYYTSKTETPRAAMLAQDGLEVATGNIFSGANSPEYCERAVPALRFAGSVQDDTAMTSYARRLLMTPPRPAA